ncbi:hypothetical protein OROGR_014644 [Orobanche gracilis]
MITRDGNGVNRGRLHTYSEPSPQVKNWNQNQHQYRTGPVLVAPVLYGPVPGYDPSTGIYGLDFYIVLERPGYRVGRRRRCNARVGLQHRVSRRMQ